MHRQEKDVLGRRRVAFRCDLNVGNRALSFASVSALQSLTTTLAGRASARRQPSRKMRVTRPPPTNPLVLLLMDVLSLVTHQASSSRPHVAVCCSSVLISTTLGTLPTTLMLPSIANAGVIITPSP